MSQSQPPPRSRPGPVSAPSAQGSLWSFAPSARIEQPVRGPEEIVGELRAAAASLGFAGLGVAGAEAFDEARAVLDAWLDAGYHGTMDYLRARPRHDPRALAPGSHTLLVGAIAASSRASVESPASEGRVARYALGLDYHRTLREKLSALGQALADSCGRVVQARACVDTAPLLEREAARRAGLGFIGKSNLLIMPALGSHVLLGALLVDVNLPSDPAMDQRCGRCTACLTACPTGAFVGPFVLDARRCISYLTIEYRGWIDPSLRPLMGTHVFGCDICQDVCPYNHGKGTSTSQGPLVSENLASGQALKYWLTLTSSEYRRLTARSALGRASRWQLLRNAAIAAGNSGDTTLTALLAELLHTSRYPIVRGHVAWALGRLAANEGLTHLRTALLREQDELVLAEITSAISAISGGS